MEVKGQGHSRPSRWRRHRRQRWGEHFLAYLLTDGLSVSPESWSETSAHDCIAGLYAVRPAQQSNVSDIRDVPQHLSLELLRSATLSYRYTWLQQTHTTNQIVVIDHCKMKGKEAYLYSAFYILCISQSAQAWITQFDLQIHHACLSFVCVHQMAPPLTEVWDS